MVTPQIPTKEEAEAKIMMLCFKLLIQPEAFTLGELATLVDLMEKEGVLDQDISVFEEIQTI